MTRISQRLEQVVKKELSQNIIPVKTEDGILVGDVLIKNNGSMKDIIKNNTVIYKEISLNKAAIAIANILALRKLQAQADKIYRADQEYGRWFIENQLLRSQYERSKKQRDFDKADFLWAKYIECRDRTLTAKNIVEQLAVF